MSPGRTDASALPPFDRRFFRSHDICSRIGDGDIGGKAAGLLTARDVVSGLTSGSRSGIAIVVPRLVIVTTAVFDAFVKRNDLLGVGLSGAPDERIAQAFQQATLPAEILGDLRSLADEARSPLAVRSSSLLEDALDRPFAGVYRTKMIPNNSPNPDERFRRLTEALKLVFASTFFSAARDYLRAANLGHAEEKMAVVVQEVVGRRHGDRFYPDLSGVAKSYNFYPTGRARPADGVVSLALGLGKTIVDGGLCWIYSPVAPAAPPPFASATEALRRSQLDFWAVNMGRPPAFDPTAETEYLERGTLADAEYDGVIGNLASTYDAGSDRLTPGIGRDGPRLIDFAPLLRQREPDLNDVVRELLERAADTVGAPVEIEFAMTLDDDRPPNGSLGFLQMRPMVVSDEVVDIADGEWSASNVVVGARSAAGNGIEERIVDVVYVRPETFESRHTRRVAGELAEFNRSLVDQRRSYLLIGFGRWGSSDPWLGIPVEWSEIAGARVIVESTIPGLDVEASQGAHFFHNIAAFQVSYLTVHHSDRPGIDWDWLAGQDEVAQSDHVRHVRTRHPLVVKVDGRQGRGAVWRRLETP